MDAQRDRTPEPPRRGGFARTALLAFLAASCLGFTALGAWQVKRLFWKLDLIERDLGNLVESLARLAEAHRETVMAGRTHGQHALPITFGFKVAVWVDELRRHAERFAQCRPRLLRCQFAGAAGTLGTRAVVAAAPDGHTLLMGQTGEIAIAPHWNKSAGYETSRDLQPIALATVVPLAMVAPGKASYSSVAEMLKTASGKGLSFASAGAGTPGHFAGEVLKYKSVLVAQSPDDFVRRLDEAVSKQHDPNYFKLLQAEAEQNTWRSRADALRSALDAARSRYGGVPRRARLVEHA